jgi:uncharacterized protein
MKRRIKTFFAGGLLAVAVFRVAVAEDSPWQNTIKSAEQGNAIAQTSLGTRYDHGDGVPQDYGMAVKWYQRAADQGYDYAQISLAWMYFQGRGVPRDYVRAHMWFNLAASTTKDPTARRLALLGRDEAAADMTPDQISEAQRMAREWKPK